MTTLAADIGGTYSRLAWLGGDPSSDVTEQVYDNHAFDDLEAVLDDGLDKIDQRGAPIEKMVLALPGPVQHEPIQLTNIHWQIRRDRLRSRFNVGELTIINDFQAAALGAVNVPFEHLKVLNAATPDDGPVVVTGAGTGLGMAWLARRNQSDLPQATEGGHIDFAPTNAAQVELYRWLAERYGRVSYERILCGDGLLDTYRSIAGNSARAQSPAEIVAEATRHGTHASAALHLFVDVFAAYAGNLALAFNPTGGLYIGGGLSAHLADWFDPATFQSVYANKGRMSDVVRHIPVFLVAHHKTGLEGAIRIARQGRVSPWA